MKEKAKPQGRKPRQAKDRVLQARIPEQLDEELRDRAEKLGLSVSTVVRNVLLHTFDLVEGVVIDSSQIARALTGKEPATVSLEKEQPVIGWQELVLNKNGVCDECNAILPLGQRAAVGVPTGPRTTLLCMECLTALASSAHGAPTSPKRMATRKRSPKSTSPRNKNTAQ